MCLIFFPFLLCRKEVCICTPCTVWSSDTPLLIPCQLFGQLLARSRVNIWTCVFEIRDASPGAYKLLLQLQLLFCHEVKHCYFES